MTGWTTSADIRAAVQREWDSGRMLAARLPGAHLPAARVPGGRRATEFPFAVRIRRPSGAEVGARFDEVQAWVAELSARTGAYRLEQRAVPSRALGPQKLPAVAWVDTPMDAARLIGTVRAVAAFDRLVAATPPEYLAVVGAQPLAILALAEEWPQLLSAATWMRTHPRPGIFLRQLDLPGVHTKVIERNRRLLAAMVGAGEPAAGPGWFERGYGFATKPALLRFRTLDAGAALVPGLTDLTLPVGEFAALPGRRLRRVFVTENEINFLTFPPVPASIVVFGSGNEAPERVGAVDWLRDVAVHYWGDIDTHGFAILDRFRARLPHTASLLMDEQTLLRHRDSWGVEETQARRDLPSLTDAEALLYAALREGTFGDRVRLEQEFVTFGAVHGALAGL